MESYVQKFPSQAQAQNFCFSAELETAGIIPVCGLGAE